MFLFQSAESLVAALAGQVDFYLTLASAPDGMRQAANDGVEQFNSWVKSESGRLEAEKANLERLKKAIEGGGRGMAAGTGVETHSVMGGQIKEWNRRLAEFNAQVGKFNETSDRRRRELEVSRKSVTGNLRQCQRWLNRNGPLKLSTRINRLFGHLLDKRRSRPGEASRLNPLLEQLRSLRARMARQTIQAQSLSSTGILIVQGRLENEGKEAEECWFMVDNGCGSSTFTPEIVQAMRLETDKRVKIKLRMADGRLIKAPPCAAPGVTVNGSRALFIKGIVMRETTAGLDGTLGMSFLSRFDFSIQKAAPQRLVLQPARLRAGGEFDVFICYKSEDAQHARLVYTHLAQRGYRPFFSEVSVPNSQSTEFSVLIDQAIESARHMVVICAKPSHVTATYVKAEWGLFEGLRRSGRKSGNIVPVLFEGMTPNQLPSTLSVFHSITANGPAENWIGPLIGFLPRH